MDLVRSRLTGFLIATVLLLACGGRGGYEPLESWQVSEGVSRLVSTYDGFERKTLVWIPKNYDPTKRYPLVFGFHGAMCDPDDWLDWLDDLADKHDFIGIYPAGIKHNWEVVVDGRQVDDCGYVESMISWADKVLSVDSFRRYAIGYSAGGFLVNHLGLRIRGLAGIAAISGTFHQNPKFSAVSPPRRIFLIHGVNDPTIPYEGGMSDLGYSYEPAESSALKWSRALGCNQDAEVISVSDRVTEIRYAPCRGAGEVRLLKVLAGHSPQEYVDDVYLKIWDFWESGL